MKWRYKKLIEPSPRALLRVLAVIDAHRITCTALERATGLATASVKRILQYARRILGLKIIYVRAPRGCGNHGWYEIHDWGVFDPRRVRAWAGRRR